MEILYKILFLVACLPAGLIVAGTVVGWCMLIFSKDEHGGPIGCLMTAVAGLVVGAVGGLLWLAFGGPMPW